ncbi:sensor histidine kinase [Sulfitobacter sp. TBRI5]|uniref:sensor histidine kinase n=1 Tax=Sulfitobacter sp. TBRI5 TaxID=2989732 RepID=UPI003D9BED8E
MSQSLKLQNCSTVSNCSKKDSRPRSLGYSAALTSKAIKLYAHIRRKSVSKKHTSGKLLYMKVSTMSRHWRRLTLPSQFVLAGGAVMLVAMILVGSWVSRRIEHAAVQNFAILAANYVESFISPLTQELASGTTLSEPAQQAMIEVFASTALSERVVSYKIWKQGGLIVHSSDPSLVGQKFTPSDDLQAAWMGDVSASFGDLNDEEDATEAMLGVPLLEVYSPIHEVFSGEIIAVAEFYERADGLQAELRNARRTTWFVVGSAFIASGLLLIGIVKAGGQTIERQRGELQKRLTESEQLVAQKNALRRRAITANQRATAQLEQTIRRVGSDLHDGPAQHLSFAALCLDSAFQENAAPNTRDDVRSSIDRALEEIRAISRGLALPELDELDMPSLVKRAVTERETQSGNSIDVTFEGPELKWLSYADKLCVYRFLQEGLSNAFRHGGVEQAQVFVQSSIEGLRISVKDKGSGFDMNEAVRLYDEGGQGLNGLKDRSESIGGKLEIVSEIGLGTTLTLHIPNEESA